MALKLSPGEQVLFEGHPSWRAILAFYAKGLLITLVAAVIAKLVSNSGAAAGVAFIGVAVTLLAGFIKRVTTSYTITNRRLHIQRGIVSRQIQETRLERVQNVNYSQGFFQRLLQVGDVNFDTAGSSDYDFVFFGVANPSEVSEDVDRATGMAGNELGTPGARPPAESEPTQ